MASYSKPRTPRTPRTPWATLLGVVTFTFGLLGAVASSAALITEPLMGPAGKIHYVDDGPKMSTQAPVVLVHSFAGSNDHWAAQVSHLRTTRRVIALDLRGHGRSDAPPQLSGYTVEGLASDIGVVADALSLERFVLVGHSIGGAAAAAYAARNPQRVSKLVLVGAPGRTPAAQADKIMGLMRSNYEAVNEKYWKSLLTGARPETEATVVRDMRILPRETAMALIGATFAFDSPAALAAYPGPKLLIDSVHGNGSNSLYRQVPGVPRYVLSGTSHWPHMDKPAEFNRQLDAFL